MSAPDRQIRTSVQAEQDYSDIFLYSLMTWERDLAAEYMRSLDNAIDLLVEFPDIGRTRDDLGPNCRSIRVDRHVVYYRVLPDAIHVMRILHQRQSTAGQFDDID